MYTTILVKTFLKSNPIATNLREFRTLQSLVQLAYKMNASNSSGLSQFTNLTSSSMPLSLTITLSTLARVTSVLQNIYFLIDAYLIPFYLTFVIINNLLCLSVFLFNSEFQHSHSTNARYYYTSLAVIDIIAVYDWEFPFFTGDGLNYASGGTIYWYEYKPQ